MPRSNLCRPDYSIASDKVIRWIKRQEKQKVVAKAIGISEALMSYKLKHKAITLEELMKIFHFLETEPDEIGRLLKY